jgi:hypothetical protein
MLSNGTYPAGFGKVTINLEPKAIQDETSESNFDEFGRMSAFLGVEVVPAVPGLANSVLLPYTFPTSEVLDASKLPKADVTATPIATGDDGTQIWKITHNGVDTHPIHFHATDVQILNRTNWDNVIKPPHPSELGWKDTIRVSPLEDTYVAMRPIPPALPWELANSVRVMSPMMKNGAAIQLSSVADVLGLPINAFSPQGEPIDVFNHYVNYGAEYVYHCHILSHEEMDMMRPFSFAYPPNAPDLLQFSLSGTAPNLTVHLTWNDNSVAETGYVVERKAGGGNWETLAVVDVPLTTGVGDAEVPAVNTDTGQYSYDDTTFGATPGPVYYRVYAQNVVGDTQDYADPNLNELPVGEPAFPVVTARSATTNEVFVETPPVAPTGLTGQAFSNPNRIELAWQDNALNETGYRVERRVGTGAWVNLTPTPLAADTVTFTDTAVTVNTAYQYRVVAFNLVGDSPYSNTLTISMRPVPTNATATRIHLTTTTDRITVTWTDPSTQNTSFTLQRATNAVFTTGLQTYSIGASVVSFTQNVTHGVNYYYRIRANYPGASSYVNVTPFPVPPHL